MLTKCGSASTTKPRGTSIRRVRANHRLESGQTLLEVAFLLPLLLLLALGVIDLGRYGYIAILVGNAARAGTAYGSQSLPQSVDTVGIRTAVGNDFQNNGQNASNLTITSAVSCGWDNGGDVTTAACTGNGAANCTTCGQWVVVVSVTASGSFLSLFNYPGIPRPIAMTRTSAMRVRPV
jgi:Flp pilus assembly protein TadG